MLVQDEFLQEFIEVFNKHTPKSIRLKTIINSKYYNQYKLLISFAVYYDYNIKFHTKRNLIVPKNHLFNLLQEIVSYHDLLLVKMTIKKDTLLYLRVLQILLSNRMFKYLPMRDIEVLHLLYNKDEYLFIMNLSLIHI